MSEEEEEAIKNVEKFVYSILNGIGANDCKILLNYIDKQQKVIEQFAEDRLLAGGCRYLDNCFTKEDVINYYYKLIEENKNE